MSVMLTFREILDAGVWEEFCQLKGLNPWCLNEGLASSDETCILSAEDCQKLRLSVTITGRPLGSN